MEEARPLKNRTVPMDDEGHYIVTLDVFHQLHCLVSFPNAYHISTNLLLIDLCLEQIAREDLLERHQLWGARALSSQCGSH